MSAVTISLIMCGMGMVYGVYILIRHLKLTRDDVATEIKCALPIIIGVLAWGSAIYTFYAKGMDSPIDMPRLLMVVSWCWLSSQYRQKYKSCGKRKPNKQ